MRIGKRISFSLDGVWTEWGFRRHARKRINVVFRVWLISLGSNSGTPFYLNPHARVNTILTHFLRLPTARGIGRRETTAQRDAAACTRSGAKSVRTDRSSPVADRENLGSSEDCYGLGGGVGRGLGDWRRPRRRRWSGVGVAVAVGVHWLWLWLVAVGVDVAVAVAVAWPSLWP